MAVDECQGCGVGQRVQWTRAVDAEHSMLLPSCAPAEGPGLDYVGWTTTGGPLLTLEDQNVDETGYRR